MVDNDLMADIELIFRCTRCGACCHGETTVSLDKEDQRRMLACLGIDQSTAEQRYWRITGSEVQMQIRDGHCIFYKDGCSVHDGRPWRCGQWPLHPAILTDASNYSAIGDSCPGLNSTLPYAEFCDILRRVLAQTSKIRC